jgi:DNA-binding NtrC family response regulator
VFLPLVEGVPDEAAYPAALLPSVAGSETVLVAEDEESVRRMIRSVLERHGYTVLEAADGAEGRRLLEEHEARIGLLITDVVMPRLDGPSLAAQALARRPDLRVIYLPGSAEETALAAGAPGKAVFVQKPFTAARLMHAVRDVLDAGVGAGS